MPDRSPTGGDGLPGLEYHALSPRQAISDPTGTLQDTVREHHILAARVR